MVDLASTIGSFIKEVRTLVPNIGRDLVQWKDAREENTVRLDSLDIDIEFTRALLTSIKELLEHPDFPLPASQLTLPRLRIKSLQGKLNLLKGQIDGLNPKRKRYGVFPSRLGSRIDPLLARHNEISSALDVLFTDPQFQSLLNPTVPGPSEGPHDRFCVVKDDERNSPDVVLNFSTDDGGNPLTYEAQFKQAVFDPQGSNMVGAVAHGLGGVGKTCALRGIGMLPETRTRFTGGVLYTSIGAEGGLRGLFESISDFVRRAGGVHLAEEVLESRTLHHAVSKGGGWFAHVPCLFLIDDIWTVRGITASHVDQLVGLAVHRGSRIAYTTRDNAVTSGSTVRFRERESRGAEASAILLKCAGLQRPTATEAHGAFLSILDKCNGLPIALSVCGRAVNREAQLRCGDHPERAWQQYLSRYEHRPVMSSTPSNPLRDLTSSVCITLDLLAEEYQGKSARDIFSSLSVFRKQRATPFHVARRLWGVSESDTHIIIELLERFSIISVYSSETPLSLTMHDVLLDISRTMALKDGNSLRWPKCLIESYAPDVSNVDLSLQGSAFAPSAAARLLFWLRQWCLGASDPSESPFETFQNWWLRVEDDGYIYSNICRLLQQGGCRDYIQWLVSNPKWVVGQLSVNGYGQVGEDIDVALEIMSSGNHLPGVGEEKFLNSVKHAAFMAAKQLRESELEVMPWFQLHGRLVHLVNRNSFARDFLERLEDEAPRPFPRPSAGCLPAAGESLRHIIDVEGDILCHVLIDDKVVVCYEEGDDKLYITEYDTVNGTQSNPQVVLQRVGGENVFFCAQFSRSGTQLAIGLRRGIILCYLDEPRATEATVHPEESENSSASLTTEHERYTSPYRFEHVRVQKDEVRSLCFSANEERMVSGSEDGIVRVWDKGGAGWSATVLEGHSDSVRSVAISADGDRVTSGSEDRTVRVWDREGAGWSATVLEGHSDSVTSLAISADGDRVASGLGDGTVRVWDREGAGWSATDLEGHSRAVMSVAISADGDRVTSGSADGTERVWDREGAGWTATVLERHSGWVMSIAISADGDRVTSGSEDCTVRVWDREGAGWSGTVLEGHCDPVDSVAISADGGRVKSMSENFDVIAWELSVAYNRLEMIR